MKKCIAAITVLLLAGCLFPASQSLRGMLSPYKEFAMIGEESAYDVRTLKQHLPEYESIFFEFGVDSCVVAEFGRGSEKYMVEIYSFTNPAGAYGAYSVMSIPDPQPLRIGTSGRQNETTVQFIKGAYMFIIKAADESAFGSARVLAAGLGKRVKEGTIREDIFQTLPTTNRVEDSEFYFKGPKAFTRRFGSDITKALLIDNVLEGIAAQYSIGNNKVDVIRIKYPNRETTLEAVDSYLRSRRDRPILHARENFMYHTVVEENNKEVYISELVDVLYIMFGGISFGDELKFFEYLLRGGR